MKKVLPQGVWSNIIEIDLTNLSIQSLFENLKKTLERIDLLKDKIVEIKGTDFSDPVTRSLANVAARNLNETITGSWTFSSPITVQSISGPNNQNLIITGKNYGVEIRIDEDSSGHDSFIITRGADGSTTLMLVHSAGNVGIGTTSPTQKLDVSGNIRGTQFISTATTGTAPFQVSSTTKVDNLNADLLDGYNSSTSATANTVAVRDSNANLSASRFISTISTGTAPLQVSSNTLVTNLNSDLLDDYHASTSTTASTIAVRDSSGNLSANAFVSTANTGTAPFQVSSTTKVANLNADFLDGYDSADFARKAENATITGSWTFNSNLAIQQGKLISYSTFHKVMYPRWGFATNISSSANKWQKIGTFTATNIYSKIHIHAIIFGGRDEDDPYATQHLVMSLDTGGSIDIATSNYVLGLYLEHTATSGTTNQAIKDVRIVIPDPTSYPNVAELWVQWNTNYCTVSPEVHIIINGFNYTINTDLADDANAASTTPPNTGTVLVPNHSRIADLANKLATARTISLSGSLSGSASFDGSSNITISASINAGAVGTTQIADNAVTAAKLASGAVTGNLGYAPVNKAGDTMTGTLVLTHTTPLQVTSNTLITNLNADLLDGYHASDFPRKSENATISGTWTFSATPSFGAGLRITGGAGTWTSNGWAKAIDLFKGQSLVWRTGGGLSIGLGVGGSSNTLYFSSSTVDDNSAAASYPIVFDIENGRIGIGTTTPSEKLEVNGGSVKASVFISTASTGIAPLRVFSTTKVDNLNADLLDGYDSTDFPRKNENATITGSWTFNNTISAGNTSATIGTLTVNNNTTVKGDLTVEGGANAIAIKEGSSDSTPGYLEKVSDVLRLTYTSTNPVRVYRGTTAGQADLEIYKDAGSGNLPIYLRFHQSSRYWMSIKASGELISFVNGDDTGFVDIQARRVTATQDLVVAGNTIANSSGIPYGPLPALGNRNRDILVDRVAVWGDGMYPFALDLYKSDEWFTIPRYILYGAYGQYINGSIGPRSNTTRVLRIYITGVDNARDIYDPTNQYWNNGRTTGVTWIRLIKGSNTWDGPLTSSWSGSPNVKVYVIELPVSFLNSYFQVALGIWWDSNSPSWPTANISGDTITDNYQNYGVDIQWTIYQVWFEIYDRY
jgi:hypothetical protein